MPAPTYVTVHAFAHATSALNAAAAAGVPVALLSAPGAAAYAGPGWWVELLAAAEADTGRRPAAAFLDCAERPGDALAAYRAGVAGVIFTGRSDVADKLRALANAHGAAFRTDRPAALDLLDARDPHASVAAHLAGR